MTKRDKLKYALYVAVNVLSGEGGGYEPDQLKDAAEVLRLEGERMQKEDTGR